MKPSDDFHNGDEASGSDSGSEAEAEGEAELWVEDAGAPARALAALNALRKSRQHYDVVLVAGAGGGEVPAHRALLAAASPTLLGELAGGAAAVRVPHVAADALAELVQYVYTGRLRAADAAGARRLYAAAWRLRLDAARLALAERLARRLQPADCLDTRALPDLPPDTLAHLDAYISEHFDELCSNGALSSLPLVRIELLRASDDADEAGEQPRAAAEAALAWLRDHNPPDVSLEELCSRTHLVYVAGCGELRDCGQLPAARGDAPELDEYRAQARRRERLAGGAGAGAGAGAAGGAGARGAAACGVLAARAAHGTRVVRALLLLRGRLLAARLARRAGARGDLQPAETAQRAHLNVPRCAHGAAVLGGRVVVCGGYDRARVLRAAEAYDPRDNAWRALPDMRSPRARFPAARLGSRLYVLGGSDGHSELDSVDVYEEGVGWSTVTRLPAAASHAAAAAHEGAAEGEGALYVVGGWAGGRSLRTVHVYRPCSGEWSDAPPLLTGRSQCAGVLWGGWLWALGGCDAWRCLASTERLRLADPDAGWARAEPLPTARRSVGGTVWRGRLVSVGGSDGAASLRRCDWLLPAGGGGGGGGETGGGGWVAGPALRRPRAALALQVLDDVLYAIGGFDGKEFLSCVECLYCPEGEWTTLTSPGAPPSPSPSPAASPAASPSPPGSPGRGRSPKLEVVENGVSEPAE